MWVFRRDHTLRYQVFIISSRNFTTADIANNVGANARSAPGVKPYPSLCAFLYLSPVPPDRLGVF